MIAGSGIFIVRRWSRRWASIGSCIACCVGAVARIVTESAAVVADNVCGIGLVAVLIVSVTVGRWAVI